MLRHIGYRVGETQPMRRETREPLLEFVFECHLPPVGDRTYYFEWGKPLSAQRLGKLANTLAALTRNAKRRDASLAGAIRDWENDLSFLYRRYYLAFFQFGWPGTEPA